MKQIIAIFTLTFLLISCGGSKKEEQKAEDIQEQVDETVDNVTQEAEEVVEKVEEKTEEVKEEVKETTKTIAKKTEELASGVKKVVQGKGEWTGNVISLTDFVTGNSKNLTKDEAIANVKNKKMMAFVVDGTPYLVFNTDGSYANKTLALALEDGVVNIKGKLNSVGGMNTIIADIIE